MTFFTFEFDEVIFLIAKVGFLILILFLNLKKNGMNCLKKIRLIGIFIFSINILPAQTTLFTQTFGSSDIEQIGGLVTNTQQDVFIIGTYGNDFNIGDKTLISNGIADVFISKKNANGSISWAKSAGSNDRDKVTGLQLFEDSILYFSGTFWDNATFDSFALSATGNALFIAQYDTSGQAIWVEKILGNGLKDIAEGKIDLQGNYYITGTFSNNLYFPNDTLTAVGTSDAFIAKYDKNGNHIWAKSAGYQLQTIATSVAINGIGEVYITGQFDGRVIFGNDTLYAAAQDFDIFFAKYDANGNLQLGKRFGGIFNNTNPKIEMGIFGKVIMAGTFIGLLNLDQNSVQTNNFDSDIFLASLDSDGNVLSQKQFGGSENEVLDNLTINIEDIYLSGYFRNNTVIDNINISTSVGNLQNLLIRTTDSSPQVQPMVISYGSALPSSSAFVSTYYDTPNSEIALAGTFQGSINLPMATTSPVSNGFTDVFLVGIELPPVNTFNQLLDKNIDINIFPNPTTDFINIKINTVELFNDNEIIIGNLYNQNGQIQRTFFIKNKLEKLNISHLPKGIYYLTIKNQTSKIVVY